MSALTVNAPPTWSTGDQLITAAYVWLAEHHRQLGAPPFVIDQAWHDLSDAVDRAHADRDVEGLRNALRAFAVHAVEQTEIAAGLRCPECRLVDGHESLPEGRHRCRCGRVFGPLTPGERSA